MRLRGEIVKALRGAKGLTQAELGTRLGYKTPQASITAIECGRSGLSYLRAKRLASILGVSLDSLAEAESDRAGHLDPAVRVEG